MLKSVNDEKTNTQIKSLSKTQTIDTSHITMDHALPQNETIDTSEGESLNSDDDVIHGL